MNQNCNLGGRIRPRTGPLNAPLFRVTAGLAALLAVGLSSCAGDSRSAEASAPATVGVTSVVKKTLSRQITLSSELVPFEEIDVYAKEAGYVSKLYVDYGTRVKSGQVMATLEIPELQDQLQEDQAQITNASDEISRAQHELMRYQAQGKALQLEDSRLNSVFQTQPGIVAQQEVDDAQGKDLAAQSQIESAQAALRATESNLSATKAKFVHDQTLYEYSKITAPFSGVVTERYANLGTLVQAGTASSTQAMPIVKLSQDSLFRLVIPVPESYVRYIRVGDPVNVRVPSLSKTFLGKVARFSVDVKEDTRTMHTEVDVANPQHLLVPGVYAEADLTLEQRDNVLTVPLQAINHEGDRTSVMVVNRQDQLEDRPVTLGLQTANDAEVVSGLSDGERIVVSDRSGLKPGEKVHPQIVQVMEYREGAN